MVINTEVPSIVVEIDDKEYELAPRTIEVAEKILEAEKAAQGKPLWQLWRTELEILLGKTACRELFPNGKRENLDRMQRIYSGVSKAFNTTNDEITAEPQEQAAQSVAETLAPMNEMLRRLKELDSGGRKQIHK